MFLNKQKNNIYKFLKINYKFLKNINVYYYKFLKINYKLSILLFNSLIASIIIPINPK